MTTENATLHVVGRGQLTAEVRSYTHSVTIRLDDRRDDAFWAEIHLSEAMLLDLLGAVHARQSDECAEEDCRPDDRVTLPPECQS